VSGLLVLLLLHHVSIPLVCFFVEEWLNTDSASLGPEMTAQSVCTGKAPSTAPLTGPGQFATADEFLLARV
jgi:hypothetical protein